MPLHQDISNSIRKLIARGLEQSYVTYDALNAAMPSDEYTNEQVEIVARLLSEKGVAIRDAQPEETVGHAKSDIPRCCNFCGKNAAESQKLIASNNGRICLDCISLCMVVLAQFAPIWFDKKVEEARLFKPPDLSGNT